MESARIGSRSGALFFSFLALLLQKKSRDLFLASKWDKEEGVPYILARPSSACTEGFVGERMSYYASLIIKGGLLLHDGWVPYRGLMRDGFKR
jgi:hypothetical protein